MKLNLGVVSEFPSNQTEIDIFKDNWTYDLPLNAVSGEAKTFKKGLAFLDRCHKLFGSFSDFDVLELGPLEGEITYHIKKLDPKNIVAIEARVASYLKCLIVGNILGFNNVRFMLGDFIEYLEKTPAHADILFAPGVLYHMVDPVRLISLAAKNSDRLFIGTHYYDEELLRWVGTKQEKLCGIANPNWNMPADSETSYAKFGFECNLYQHNYNVTIESQMDPDKNHHHGIEMHAYFMKKDDIVRAIKHFGMDVIDVVDMPNLERGPYVEIIAASSLSDLPSGPGGSPARRQLLTI